MADIKWPIPAAYIVSNAMAADRLWWSRDPKALNNVPLYTKEQVERMLRAAGVAPTFQPSELHAILEFLYGAAPLDGCWFGHDRHPPGHGRYWWRSRLRAALTAAGVTVLDPLNDTQAELDAVSREMDVVYARWPKTKKEDDEHRVIREGLLAPLRARCVEIGQRRYRIAAGVAACGVAERVMSDIEAGRSAFRQGKPREGMLNESARIGWDEAAHDSGVKGPDHA